MSKRQVPKRRAREPVRRVTLSEVRRWPAVVNVSTAATAFGVSRSKAYDLIARGDFPAKVMKLGDRYKVVTASIVRSLSDGGG